MSISKPFIHIVVSLVSIGCFLAPLVLFAQGVPTLTDLPGGLADSGTTEGYLSAAYAVSIAIAALLVTLKLILAGVKYMFSEIVTDKSDAKKDIQAALLGIAIILAAVLILRTINPELTNMNALRNAEPSNSTINSNNETFRMQDGTEVACIGVCTQAERDAAAANAAANPRGSGGSLCGEACF